MFKWLKHAFAVESSGPAIPSPMQAAAIDTVCGEIIRRQMSLPAQMLFESSAPLHFVAGQMLRFVEPFLGIVLEPAAIRDFATFLEKRGAVEFICCRFEELQTADCQQLKTPDETIN